MLKRNSKKMKIVILDAYAANPGDIEWDEVATLGDLVLYDRTSPEEVLARAKGAEIILTNKVILSKETLEALTPELRYVGVLATGYNVVDTAAARQLGIVVTNIPAYSTMSVAQMVFAHLLHITHHVSDHSASVRKGDWQQSPDFCYWLSPLIELDGKTMGIVGLGNTGSAVANIALSLGMKVLAYTSKNEEQLPSGIQKAGNLEQLFSESDVLSLHCPLTSETHHLVCQERLAHMKQTAILINTGRGPLVDEQALAMALTERKIYAAGIDVLTEEPPRSGSPLLSAPNCYITPHIAWATQAARRRLIHTAAENITCFLQGSPIHVVN